MIAALALLLAPAPLPAQDSAPRPARVAAATVQAHAFFDARSPAIARFEQGVPLRVLEVKTPWARVQAPGGFDLWVHGEFVSWKGADGVITAGRVNARPLASDDNRNSSPVGRFDKGDAVVRTGHEGAWIRVRAPERISGWVKLEEIEILDAEPAGWAEAWAQAAAARAPVREEPPAPAPVPAPAPGPAPAPDAPPAPQPAPSAGETITAVALPPAAATPASAKREASHFPAAQIAKEPTRWLDLASRDLAAFRGELANSYEAWQDARAEELEAAFSNVLWHSALPADLEGARRGLSSLDALRLSYADWLNGQRARAAQASDAAATARWDARLAALQQGWGSDGEGGALLTGWVEFRPSVNENRPYAVVRSGTALLVHDFSDRWHLGEYAGREIVARGSWREEEGAPGRRVLAITELRILPAPDSR